MNTAAKGADRVIELPAESFSRREERALPTVVSGSSATSLLQAITQAASNPQIDIEKMERLFTMHQKMVAQEAEAAFNDALARAQAKILPIASNAYNDHTKSRYAKLDAVCNHITPIFSAEGLSISFDTGEAKDPKEIRVLAFVSHSRGHTRPYHIDLPRDDAGSKGTTNKTGVQATGSTNSYGRRYLQFMIANLSTFDDDDGNRNKRTDGGDEKQGLSEQQYADFEAKIDEFTDPVALGEFWKIIVKACNSAKDVDAGNTLKAKVTAKGKTLTKGKSK